MFPTSAKYTVQENAWINRSMLLDWIERVWYPFCQDKQRSCLIMDECAVHIVPACVEAIQRKNTTLMYNPRPYTATLQVLDVGVNKQFKDFYRRQYNNFLLTTGERKISRLHVATWISTAWCLISSASIKRTWDSIGCHPSE